MLKVIVVLVFLALAATTDGAGRADAQSGMVHKKGRSEYRRTQRKEPRGRRNDPRFLYEYSPKHHTCVAVTEYKTTKNGHPSAQVLARNMVTNQPMRGLAEIYLIPMSQSQERLDAINKLFDEYSK